MAGLLTDFTQQPQGGGLFGAIGNFLSGLNPAAPEYQARLQQNLMNQQYQAFQQMGMSPQQALIATMHPDLLQQAAKPMTVEPGGSVYSQFNPFSLGVGQTGGGQQEAAPQGNQPYPTTPQGSVNGVPAGGPSGAPIGGPSGIQYQNQNGLLRNQPGALQTMVDQRLLGDDSVEKGNSFGGMGALGKINFGDYKALLTKTMADRGITPADLVARTGKFPAYKQAQERLATVQSNMGTAQIEFQQIWPQFMAAVQNYGPSRFPTFNAFRQWAQAHAGDPGVPPINQYITTLRNIYGRAISTRPQGPTDSDKGHFDEGMNAHWNTPQFQALGNTFAAEMGAAQQSIPKMRNVIDVEYGLGKRDPAILQQAQGALAKGADRNQVIQRLKENGLDPGGL